VRLTRVAMFGIWCLLGACAHGTTHAGAGTGAPPGPQVVLNDAVARERARADSAARPYTVADIEFVSGMIAHHAQAIAMSRLAPTHGAGASIRTLAARIINAQQDEIRIMQQWLADRGLPVTEARPTGMRMVMNGMEHDMLMPGMLSSEQMKELDAARGAEFDKLFLRYMIQHHRGALTMVGDLLDSPGAAIDLTVFKLSSDIHADQTTEIARMERMLADLVIISRN
jgi:uncharacterized protein (DUF305 family)